MKIYLEWLEIPCIGIYSGPFGSNLLFGDLSMDFVSQEHGVPHDGPKDSNAGG
jgi:hypothetical protein